MKIARDPTPFHHDYEFHQDHELLEFSPPVAELVYECLQLTPHRDFIPFFIGLYDRPNTVIVSWVFAEGENMQEFRATDSQPCPTTWPNARESPNARRLNARRERERETR